MCYGLVISKQLSAKETVFSDGGLGAFFFFFWVIVVKSVGGHWKQAHQNPALLFTSLLTLGRLSPLVEPWISHP